MLLLLPPLLLLEASEFGAVSAAAVAWPRWWHKQGNQLHQ